jgi:glycosyltransferase involved in cell wall biosynthesis
MNPVTVLIPVGPQSAYLQWLPEAIDSVFKQTAVPDEILILADGFNLWAHERLDVLVFPELYRETLGLNRSVLYSDGAKQMWVESSEKQSPKLSYWQTPWNIGFAQIFNCGVGLALHDNIVYLASDDRLMSSAIEDCLQTWHDNNEKDAWYALSYQVGSDVYTIPNNAAMITRALWRWLKGYPPSAFAGPDALTLSRLMIAAPDRIIKVKEKKANYWVREHPYQDTKRQFSFFAASGIMEVIRDMETRRFEPDTSVVLK